MKKREPLYRSFYYAFCGIKEGISSERNMLIHFCFVLAVIICGVIFKISKFEWIICFGLFALVISLELLNTAIENTVDICAPQYNKKAKIAKDTSAGAVLVSAIISALIGLIIFVPKLITFFF